MIIVIIIIIIIIIDRMTQCLPWENNMLLFLLTKKSDLSF
jgi:hypothetical protein